MIHSGDHSSTSVLFLLTSSNLFSLVRFPYFQYISNIFPIYFQYISNICPIYFQYISNIFPIYFQYIPMPLKSTLHSPASTGIVVAHECRHRIRSLEASLALGEPSENAVRKWLDNDGNGWKCYEMVNICQNGLKWSENLLRQEKQIWVHNVKLRKGCCFLLPAMTVPSTSSSKIHHRRWWTVHSIKGFKMFQVFPLIRNNSNSHAFLIVSQSLSSLIVVTIVVWHGQTAPETWNSKKIQETSNEPNTATQNRRLRCRQGSKILCLRCGWSVIDVRNVQGMFKLFNSYQFIWGRSEVVQRSFQESQYAQYVPICPNPLTQFPSENLRNEQ